MCLLGCADMTQIDLEIIGLAISVVAPMLAYLHLIHGDLKSLVDRMNSCPYCNRTIEVMEKKDD